MADRSVQEKYQDLRADLERLGGVAVAFSGGVDSTFLLWTAHDVLGDRAVAVTAASCSFPERERREAEAYCQEHGIRHVVCRTEELDIPGFRQNPENRCYLCKRGLFREIFRIAREQGCPAVAEGSNMDDEGDYRPGLAAVRELGVSSPLRAAGLHKEEIRALSKELGIPTWDKPSFACLASRFPYGEEISEEKLSMVERGEQFLLDRGFRQVRVRIHGTAGTSGTTGASGTTGTSGTTGASGTTGVSGTAGTVARIEVPPEDLPRFLDEGTRRAVHDGLRAAGFTYVALDLAGYRTGSMNEALTHRGQDRGQDRG